MLLLPLLSALYFFVVINKPSVHSLGGNLGGVYIPPDCYLLDTGHKSDDKVVLTMSMKEPSSHGLVGPKTPSTEKWDLSFIVAQTLNS